jgi:hypothetical protein
MLYNFIGVIVKGFHQVSQKKIETTNTRKKLWFDKR